VSTVLRIKDRIFYGWVVVAASLVIACIFLSIRLSFGVFFKSLQAEFELTRAATSSLFSTYMILGAITGIICGWATDRYGPRIVISLMGLVTGLALLISSLTTSLWQIFLSYSLLLAIGTGGIVPVLITSVSRWFDKKRGIAIAITTIGTSLGTLIGVPVAAYLVSNLDWRMSFVVMGLAAWVVVFAMAALLRRDPSEMGLLPDGVALSDSGIKTNGAAEVSHISGAAFRQVLGTRSLWIMAAIFLLFATCFSLIATHFIPYATDLGIPLIGASTIISVIGGLQIPGRLSAGRISDIIGRKIPGIVLALLTTGALVWLTRSHTLGMFYIFAIAFGFSMGGFGVIILTLPGEIFGKRNLGVIMGIMEIGFSIGSAAGALLGGFVYDATNNYNLAFTISIAVMSITAILIALVRREATAEADV